MHILVENDSRKALNLLMRILINSIKMHVSRRNNRPQPQNKIIYNKIL